jgi:hypothetical protein
MDLAIKIISTFSIDLSVRQFNDCNYLEIFSVSL